MFAIAAEIRSSKMCEYFELTRMDEVQIWIMIICRSRILAIIVALKGSIKLLRDPMCTDAVLVSWMGMSSQTVAVEGAVTEEIYAATEILFVSNFIFIPFGILIIGEKRRCIFLL